MEKLIEALQIFLKYGNPERPTHCEHEELWICGYDWDSFAKEDRDKLDELGFFSSEEEEGAIKSYRYGSA